MGERVGKVGGMLRDTVRRSDAKSQLARGGGVAVMWRRVSNVTMVG